MLSWLTGKGKGKDEGASKSTSSGGGVSSLFSFGGEMAYKKQATVKRAAGEYDHLFKILTVGDSGVGKSCFILRFADDSFFGQSFISTIGVDFKIKTLEVDGRYVKLQLWDTTGQERFRTITSSYYRGAHGIAILYDVTDRSSFDNVSRWISEVERYACSDVAKILIGHKIDDTDRVVVSRDEGQELADSYGMSFMEASAKENINVTAAVLELVRSICQTRDIDLNVDTKEIKMDVVKQVELESDSDEESFSDGELNADLNDLLDDNLSTGKKKRSKKGKKGVKHKKTDVNVFRLAMKNLGEDAAVMTGDPELCHNCGVMMNSSSKLISQKESAKLNLPEPIDCVLAPPIHDKLEAIFEREPDEDYCSVWVCEFCGAKNLVEVEEEEIPTSPCVDYIIQPPPVFEEDDASFEGSANIIFCIDVSGSMCVTTEVDGKFSLKGADAREKSNSALMSEFGEGGNQWMPRQKRRVTWVSRLQCVKAAVEQQILKISRESPGKHIGLITFSNDVTIIGDGTQEEISISGDKLYSYEELKEIAVNYTIPQPISNSKDTLLEKLWALEEGGATALGPALQIGIQIAGSKPGSRVILCTDGLANVGVGALDENQSEEGMESYYGELAEQAKLTGVSVSVISIIGDECNIELLSSVTEQTAGSVDRVDPIQLTGELSLVVDKPILGYTTMAMIILHQGLRFRNEMDDENENRNWLVKDLGNVRADTELTVSYGFRSKEEFDLSDVTQIPFQVQLLYTKPNGMQCLRIATAQVAVTDDRKSAEEHADLKVIGTHAAKQLAKFAKKGDFESAQMEARAAQRFMVRNGVEVEGLQKWTKQVNQVDQVMRTEKKDNKVWHKKTKKSDATATVLSKATTVVTEDLF
eukprot:CAMPEP_0174250422 /NCGR_PEP_ID=MMETSP0439-20130205/594_1 /TAXON_ID=0 /ORGANISM="Stereomyxa ramosa, Strain Chinc5" /LENGTH=871 /DNA_ID=CAMNT_0015330485 /DNA_START=21 /DNA_END=2636 /DNA_ORIENTATION=+